jgi:hypothetical protein
MTFNRALVAVFALVMGLALGACSSFSDTVSDHWPHFAGGEPNGLPPRPGTPGYATYIAHGQSTESVAPAGSTPPGASGQTAVVSSQKPVGGNQQPSAYAEPAPQYRQQAAPLTPAAARPSGDPSVAQGGLY